MMLRAYYWWARTVDRLAVALARRTAPAPVESLPTTLARWCPGIDRAPHLSADQPPTVTVVTDHGPVTVCRGCWHRWSSR